LLVAAVSCKKEQTTTDMAQGEATLARIMNFKQQVDYYKANPAVKEGETVTIDEAVWNIEALFNLTYAYPELSYGHTVTADTVLYLPLQSDNTVLLTDLTVFYGQMYEVISDIYHDIELDNKRLLLLDVEAGEQHGNQQVIRLQSVQGSMKGTSFTSLTPPYDGPFVPGILWWYGQNGGNSQNNLYGLMDAADTLSSMLNAVLIPTPPANCEFVYTQIIMKHTPSTLNEHYNNPYTGYPEIQPRYCEFYVENPSPNDYWMDSDRMNFHYYGERHLVLNILRNSDTPIPITHSLYKIIIGDNEIIWGNNNKAIGHYTTAYYGFRDVIGNNISVKGNL
jgi:hypothetical protein